MNDTDTAGTFGTSTVRRPRGVAIDVGDTVAGQHMGETLATTAVSTPGLQRQLSAQRSAGTDTDMGTLAPPLLSAAEEGQPEPVVGEVQVAVPQAVKTETRKREPSRPRTFSEAGMKLEGTSLVAVCRQRLAELGIGTALDLEEFRMLWLEVWPERTSWKDTERMFREIDTDSSGEVELSEIIAYLTNEKARGKESCKSPPTTWREITWAFVGTDSFHVTEKSLRDDQHLLRQGLFCVRTLRFFLVICFIVVTIHGTTASTRRPSDGQWGDDSTVFGLEVACVAMFTIELIAFLVSYPRHPLMLLKDISFWVITSSVVPFYIQIATGDGHPELSAFRVRQLNYRPIINTLRFLSVVTVPEYSQPKLKKLLTECWVPLLWLLVLVLMFTIASAALLYTFERKDTHFENGLWVRDADSSLRDHGDPLQFQDMPDLMWWCFATVITGDQGYDEWVPVTAAGKWVGAAISLLSIVIIAYPITMVLDTLQRDYRQTEEREELFGLAGDLHRALRRWLGKAVGGSAAGAAAGAGTPELTKKASSAALVGTRSGKGRGMIGPMEPIMPRGVSTELPRGVSLDQFGSFDGASSSGSPRNTEAQSDAEGATPSGIAASGRSAPRSFAVPATAALIGARRHRHRQPTGDYHDQPKWAEELLRTVVRVEEAVLRVAARQTEQPAPGTPPERDSPPLVPACPIAPPPPALTLDPGALNEDVGRLIAAHGWAAVAAAVERQAPGASLAGSRGASNALQPLFGAGGRSPFSSPDRPPLPLADGTRAGTPRLRSPAEDERTRSPTEAARRVLMQLGVDPDAPLPQSGTPLAPPIRPALPRPYSASPREVSAAPPRPQRPRQPHSPEEQRERACLLVDELHRQGHSMGQAQTLAAAVLASGDSAAEWHSDPHGPEPAAGELLGGGPASRRF
eukprot:TRINITY_DN14129_c0_g1_i1.p1 TRINITY_DN14129_c0_g1~~TRINITY_DN14129_c0_g1_i1.p1  ORF type:complete len:915 (+),score=241.66 TRINITY_DN14129_c0_g1_i1:98-2842(+)